MAQTHTVSIIQKLTVPLINNKKYQGLAYGAALVRTNNDKREFLNNFEKHLVTQELKEGPEKDFSYFIPDGNLFSFFGFYAGSKPEQELKEYLDENMKLKPHPVRRPTQTRNRVSWFFGYQTPTIEEIYNNTPVHGDTSGSFKGSWVKLIEGGLDNFTYYIFDTFIKKSKSGTGLQAKNPVRSYGSFKGVPYITKLLKDFIKEIKD